MANQNANDNDTNVINADNNSSNANSNRNDDHDAYEKVCYDPSARFSTLKYFSALAMPLAVSVAVFFFSSTT